MGMHNTILVIYYEYGVRLKVPKIDNTDINLDTTTNYTRIDHKHKHTNPVRHLHIRGSLKAHFRSVTLLINCRRVIYVNTAI